MKVPAIRAIYPSNQGGIYLLILIITKLLKAVGLFLAYDLLKGLHVIHFLFFVKIFCCIIFGVLQKPITSGGRLGRKEWLRVLRYAIIGCILELMWLFGLTMVGPFRFMIIFEHGEVIVIAGAAALYSGGSGPTKTRGAIFFIIGVLSLLLLDHDQRNVGTDHPEGHHSNFIFHFLYQIVSWFGLSDHKGGVVLLFLTLCLHAVYHTASKPLSVEVGGAKRLNALSCLLSTLILTPWSLATYVTYSTPSSEHSFFHRCSIFILILVFVYLIDFYVNAVTQVKLGSYLTSRVSSLAICGFGLGLSLLWNHPMTTAKTTLHKVSTVLEREHTMSGGLLFSFLCILYACVALTGATRSGTKGNFIGYSSLGLPLYTRAGEHLSRTGHSLLALSQSLLRQVLNDSGSRRIFYFLLLNLGFTGIELVYGVWTNSLGLISDGFHMLFDSSALVMGLYASVMSRWKPNRLFSFGYDRVEVLSGFINGLFLIIISINIFISGFCRVFHPPKVKTERLLVVSVLGLLVNLIGIGAFRHTHSHGGGGHGHSHGGGGHGHSHGGGGHGHSHGGGGHGHSHGGGGHGHSHANNCGHADDTCHGQSSVVHNTNMRGVFLHILADTLGSVGVIVSSLLIEAFGLYIADPICSLFISFLIFMSVIPLLSETLGILALRAPPAVDMEGLLRMILNTEGVVAVRNPTAWQLTAGEPCLALHVQVSPDVKEQIILTQLKQLVQPLVPLSQVTIQIEKDAFHQHMFGMGNKVISDVLLTQRDFNLPTVEVHFV